MDRMINSALGYPGSDEWLEFIENQSLEQINGLVNAIGDNVIVSGMIDTAGTLSAGFLIYNNELLPFESSVLGATINIIETVTSEGYDTAEDDSFDEILPVWKTRKAKFATAGDVDVVGSFGFNVLQRIEGLKTLNNNRLKILKEGSARIFYTDNVPTSILTTGDFTGFNLSFIPNTNNNTTFELLFDALENTNYFLVMELKGGISAFYGHTYIRSIQKSINKVKLNLRNANAVSALYNEIDFKIIGI
jgi:hypothetical protein